MNNAKLVSIIIPCYNVQDYIIETLDSAFSQTYENIEVICIDDGSTDGTLSILYNYQEKQPSLKVIQQENTYCVIARQNAYRHANGEYLLFLDSDDKIDQTYIKKCVDILDNSPDIGIVYSEADFFDAKHEKWKLPKFELKEFLLSNCIYITALIRKSDFNKIDGFDLNLTHFEDWELFISLIKNGVGVYQIPETLFHYRIRTENNSITNLANSKKISDNMFYIYKKHYDFYIENNIYFQGFFIGLSAENNRKRKKYDNYFTKLRYKLFKPKKYREIYLEGKL